MPRGGRKGGRGSPGNQTPSASASQQNGATTPAGSKRKVKNFTKYNVYEPRFHVSRFWYAWGM